MLSLFCLALLSLAHHLDNPGAAKLEPAAWSLLSPSTWFGARSHLGTGEVKVRFDTSRLGKGVLYLDDVDLKTSATGIIVRPPGVIALRSAVPGLFHDWRPTEYCRIEVHPNQLTVVDVILTGRAFRNADGSVTSRPICKCLIQERDSGGDADGVKTCE